MKPWEKEIIASNTNGSKLDVERESPSKIKSSHHSPPSDFESSLDSYSDDCREDQEDFINRFLDGDRFVHNSRNPHLKLIACDLQDFYAGEGRYKPKRRLPFSEDVLVGIPEKVVSAQSQLPKLGLPDDFFESFSQKLTLKMIPNDLHSFSSHSTQLGRLGGKEVVSKEPTVVSEDGLFFREFETHGRLVPLIDQNIFLKRRMDQDLTAVLNEYYKDTPEENIPKIMPWNDASAILDRYLPQFDNQVENRNNLDRVAAIGSFMPVRRLETNVIESEIKRRRNISKRPPDIDEKKRSQLDRKKKNQAAYEARKKAQKAEKVERAARLGGRFL